MNLEFLFVLAFYVVLSSSNPLESHIIGNITNYFNTIPNNTFFAQQKDFVIPKYAEKNNLRKYISRIRKLESDSFCSDMLYSFRTNQNKTISYIFILIIQPFALLV